MREVDAGPAEREPAPPPEIAWEKERVVALGRARAERRVLVAYLRAEWIADALVMERDAWSEPAVRRAMTAVVAHWVDLSAATAQHDAVLARYDVQRLPAVIAYAPDGRELARIEGPADAAALGAFLAELTRSAPRSAPR